MASDLAAFVEELYAVPPQEFTRARDARAAALKAAGRADEAKAVRQLRRPSAVLWAANQLAHAELRRLEHFVRTVADLRRTQLRDPRAAAEALRRQRAELDDLVRRAGELLAQHGHRATPAIERRVSDTLLGAAVDRRLSEELRHGRLTAEQRPPGFEVLAGAGPALPLRLVREEDGGRPLAPRRTARDPERHDHAAEGRRRQAAAEAEAAERAERERRARDAAASRRKATDLADAADQAGRELRELEARVVESRRRLREARRVASKAAAAARRAERRTSR
jgi:hypothetical protein